MKIAIFTQPLHTNYGGLLQAFALQKALKKELNADSVTINIQMNQTFWMKSKSLIKNGINKFLLLKGNDLFDFKPNAEEKTHIGVHTDAFIRDHINTTKKVSRNDINYLRKLDKDAFIVGSDQVWRPKYSPNIYTYFFGFLNKTKRPITVSYAASFGVDEWEFTPKETKKCAALAKQFDAVSVREDSGVILCKNQLGVVAKKVLDPTLLLDVGDYLKIMGNTETQSKDDFLMFYVLDPELVKGPLVEKIIKNLNLRVNSIMPLPFRKENADKIDKCVYPPVKSWLIGFYKAKFVVTDSFHGTVFSILFNKQFIALGNEQRGMSRFNSILKIFGLENRLVANIDQIDDILKEKIDYLKVNEILVDEKEKSLAFLKQSLLKQ